MSFLPRAIRAKRKAQSLAQATDESKQGDAKASTSTSASTAPHDVFRSYASSIAGSSSTTHHVHAPHKKTNNGMQRSKGDAPLDPSDVLPTAIYLRTLLSDWAVETSDELREGLGRGVDLMGDGYDHETWDGRGYGEVSGSGSGSGSDGFIPLSSLLLTSPDPSIQTLSQSQLVSFLRLGMSSTSISSSSSSSNPPHSSFPGPRSGPNIQLRIALSEPTSTGSTRAIGPIGYEVSRDVSFLSRVSSAGAMEVDVGGDQERYWRERTVYLEDIPPDSRTRIGLIKLLHNLYPNEEAGASSIASSSSSTSGPDPSRTSNPTQPPSGLIRAIQSIQSISEYITTTTPLPTDQDGPSQAQIRRSIPGSGTGTDDLTNGFVIFDDPIWVARMTDDFGWGARERKKSWKRRKVNDEGEVSSAGTRSEAKPKTKKEKKARKVKIEEHREEPEGMDVSMDIDVNGEDEIMDKDKDNNHETENAEEDTLRTAWGKLEACGMRAISLMRFEQLRTEYLAHQRDLRAKVAAAQPTRTRPREAPEPHLDRPKQYVLETSGPASNKQTHPPATASKDYPTGCVLFIRDVQIDTNKTALKALFNELAGREDAVSYVDWEKGMDSAHLRVVDAKLAGRIKAASTDRADFEMRIDVLEGRPEELYWYNLPEQIRMRALQASRGEPITNTQQNGGGRKRKR